MSYTKLISNLYHEAISFKNYKKLSMPFNVFAAILLIPMFIAASLSMISYTVMAFFYKAGATSVNYLEKWVKEKTSDVRHATEAVIYWITTPTIFFFHVILSIFSLFFFFAWFVTQVYTYLATLGGIRWQPFIMEASYDEIDSRTLALTTDQLNLWALIEFCIVFSATLLYVIISLAAERHVQDIAYVILMIVDWGFLISIPFVFKKRASDNSNDSDDDDDDFDFPEI